MCFQTRPKKGPNAIMQQSKRDGIGYFLWFQILLVVFGVSRSVRFEVSSRTEMLKANENQKFSSKFLEKFNALFFNSEFFNLNCY